jgi:hypothetical protein
MCAAMISSWKRLKPSLLDRSYLRKKWAAMAAHFCCDQRKAAHIGKQAAIISPPQIIIQARQTSASAHAMFASPGMRSLVIHAACPASEEARTVRGEDPNGPLTTIKGHFDHG